MLKKSLFFGSIAVLAALLLITGCSNPTSSSSSSGDEEQNNNNTPSGPSGPSGPSSTDNTLGDAAVDAGLLAGKFAVYQTVILTYDGGIVSGVVPSGKTLRITGNMAVKANETLAVAGTVEIVPAGKTLTATYINGLVGALSGNGQITGDGTVSLPFFSGGWVQQGKNVYDDGIIHYGSARITAKKAIGSMVRGIENYGEEIVLNDIGTLFTTENSLTLAGITGLTSESVPGGKELTLSGPDNTTSGATFAPAGDVIIAGTLSITGVTAITGTNITIAEGGVLNLGDAAHTFAGEKISNEGTITSAATAAATQKAILEGGAGEDGIVELTDDSAAALGSVSLSQNVKISAELKADAVSGIPFTSVGGKKTITIAEGGTLNLGAAIADLNLADHVTIDNTNGGSISTATLSDVALNKILKVGGEITSTGLVVANTEGITVPANTVLNHTTGAIVGGDKPLVIEGSASFTNATFASQTGPVTINGTATFGTGATFAGLITGLTIGPNADVTFTAATFTALTADLVIKGKVTLGAVAVPKGNVIVNSAADQLIIPAGSLTIKDAKTLTNNGTITIAPPSATLVLSSAADAAPNAEIAGTGTITAGATDIKGLWKVTGTAAGTLTIGSGADGVGATFAVSSATGLEAVNTTSIITQKAVTTGTSVLTVTSGAINLGVGGVLNLAATTNAYAGSTAGNGKIIAGLTEIDKVWKAVGTGNVAITGAATGANIAAPTAVLTGDTGTITQKKAEDGTSVLTISSGAVEIGATGSLTLNAANDGTAGSTSGKIIAGATEITGVWKATGASANVAITSAATGATITGGTNSLVAGTGGTITQKANPGSTSVLVVATGNLDLGTNGNLVLGTNATPSEAGSINASSGKIIAGTAGETEITKIWTAKGTGAGTVTIAGGANGAIITKTPAATGLVGGAAGLITQKAIADNNLTLDGVRVDLVTTAGKIVLTNSASNPGKVTLTSGTVIVCGTGEDVMGDPASIGGKAATIGGNLVCTYDDGDDDKLGSISGGLAPGNTITAGESNPVEIVKDAVLAE